MGIQFSNYLDRLIPVDVDYPELGPIPGLAKSFNVMAARMPVVIFRDALNDTEAHKIWSDSKMHDKEWTYMMLEFSSDSPKLHRKEIDSEVGKGWLRFIDDCEDISGLDMNPDLIINISRHGFRTFISHFSAAIPLSFGWNEEKIFRIYIGGMTVRITENMDYQAQFVFGKGGPAVAKTIVTLDNSYITSVKPGGTQIE